MLGDYPPSFLFDGKTPHTRVLPGSTEPNRGIPTVDIQRRKSVKYKLLLLLTCTLVACSNNEPAQPQATAPVADSAPLTDTIPVADTPLADDPAVMPLDPAEADAGQVVVNASDESTAPQSLGMLSTAPNLPTLVSSYRINRNIGGYEQAEYVGSVYRPRQVANGAAIEVDSYNSNGQKSTIADAKSYSGWDLLLPRNYRHNSLDTRPDWFSITLTRPAILAVGLRSKNIPVWLNSWTKSTSLAVISNGKAEEVRVFKKTFAVGKVDLGGVSARPGGENVYVVMVAEQNGAPSAVPSVPAGQEVPKPNSACPAWVHDQYMTTGPDGKQYRTWHPQIDPVYWCTFGHVVDLSCDRKPGMANSSCVIVSPSASAKYPANSASSCNCSGESC